MKKIIAGLLIAALAIAGIGIGYKINQADASGEEKSVTVLQADYPQYNTAEELVESSDLVFTGTVKNMEYQMIDVNTGEEPDEDTYPSLLNADQSSYDMDAPQTVMEGEEKEIMLSDILKLF